MQQKKVEPESYTNILNQSLLPLLPRVKLLFLRAHCAFVVISIFFAP
jgi:hypothetical protein